MRLDECRRRPRSSNEESLGRVLVAHELMFAPCKRGRTRRTLADTRKRDTQTAVLSRSPRHLRSRRLKLRFAGRWLCWTQFQRPVTPHVTPSMTRSFLKNVFEWYHGRPLIRADRGPWYDWLLERLNCESERETWGARSLLKRGSASSNTEPAVSGTDFPARAPLTRRDRRSPPSLRSTMPRSNLDTL